jgi:hypothetical protein
MRSLQRRRSRRTFLLYLCSLNSCDSLVSFDGAASLAESYFAGVDESFVCAAVCVIPLHFGRCKAI